MSHLDSISLLSQTSHALRDALHCTRPLGIDSLLHWGASGYLALLKWAKDGCGACISMEVCKVAAAKGHLHVIEWYRDSVFPTMPTIIYTAALHNQLHVVQWFLGKPATMAPELGWEDQLMTSAVFGNVYWFNLVVAGEF